MKKDLDINKIVADSLKKAYEQHGLSKNPVIINEEEKLNFDIFDQLPFLKLTKTTFTTDQPTEKDEVMFKQILQTFGGAGGDLKGAIDKLNFALGVSFDEETLQPTELSTPTAGGEKTTSFDADTFAALSVMNVMYYSSLLDPKATGLFYEPILSGLLGASPIGSEGGVTDLKYINPATQDIIEYSLKTLALGGESSFELSIVGLIEKAIELFKSPASKLKLLVVLKNAIGEDHFYTFYDLSLEKQNLLQAIYRTAAPVETKKVMEDYFSVLINAIAKKQDDETYQKAKKFIDSYINSPNDVFSVVETFQNDLNKLTDEKLKNVINNAMSIARGLKRTKINEIQKKITDKQKLQEAGGKGPSWSGGSETPLKFKKSIEKYGIKLNYLGRVYLSRNYYAKKLQKDSSSLINSIKKLLVPLNAALQATNQYFLSDNPSQKIVNLQTAASNADKFLENATDIFYEEQKKTSTGVVQEIKNSLNNLTPEAKIVMEMLQRMED